MFALEAGDGAGGDMRGKQSAALRVHTAEVYPLLNLRVDDHAAPVEELRGVFGIAPPTLPLVARFQRGQAGRASPDARDGDVAGRPPERPGVAEAARRSIHSEDSHGRRSSKYPRPRDRLPSGGAQQFSPPTATAPEFANSRPPPDCASGRGVLPGSRERQELRCGDAR